MNRSPSFAIEVFAKVPGRSISDASWMVVMFTRRRGVGAWMVSVEPVGGGLTSVTDDRRVEWRVEDCEMDLGGSGRAGVEFGVVSGRTGRFWETIRDNDWETDRGRGMFTPSTGVGARPGARSLALRRKSSGIGGGLSRTREVVAADLGRDVVEPGRPPRTIV